MTKSLGIKSWKLNSAATRALLIGAQVLSMIVFTLALIF